MGLQSRTQLRDCTFFLSVSTEIRVKTSHSPVSGPRTRVSQGCYSPGVEADLRLECCWRALREHSSVGSEVLIPCISPTGMTQVMPGDFICFL